MVFSKGGKKQKKTKRVMMLHHLGRGVRMQWSVMESFIQIPQGLAIQAKLSLTSELIRCWNMTLCDPWRCINIFCCNEDMMTERTRQAPSEVPFCILLTHFLHKNSHIFTVTLSLCSFLFHAEHNLDVKEEKSPGMYCTAGQIILLVKKMRRMFSVLNRCFYLFIFCKSLRRVRNKKCSLIRFLVHLNFWLLYNFTKLTDMNSIIKQS